MILLIDNDIRLHIPSKVEGFFSPNIVYVEKRDIEDPTKCTITITKTNLSTYHMIKSLMSHMKDLANDYDTKLLLVDSMDREDFEKFMSLAKCCRYVVDQIK